MDRGYEAAGEGSHVKRKRPRASSSEGTSPPVLLGSRSDSRGPTSPIVSPRLRSELPPPLSLSMINSSAAYSGGGLILPPALLPGGGGGYVAPGAAIPSSSSPLAAWDAGCVRALLKQTKLYQLRESVLAGWLRDACDWLPETAAHPDLRFHLVEVLATMPWWRYVVSPEGKVSRAHVRTFTQFERVCMVLMGQTPHLVKSVIDVALLPFSTPPASDTRRHCLGVKDADGDGGEDGSALGWRPLIPIESICRILNHVSVKYPNMVPDILLEQCIEPLLPKKRWPYVDHHIAFLTMLMRLALDATLPSISVLLEAEGAERRALMDHRSAPTSPVAAEDSSSEATAGRGGTGPSSSVYDSEAATPQHRATSMMLKGTGAPPPSPASSSASSSTLWGAVASASEQSTFGGGLSNASVNAQLDTATPHNNRLMQYRNGIIQLLLRHLMDMELTLAYAPQAQSSSHVAAAASAVTPNKQHPQEFAEDDISMVVPSDLDALRVLRHCSEFVHDLLAEDLRLQHEAGNCGNATWWKDVLSFHVNSVILLDRSVALHLLAPRLAVLASGAEAADLVHGTISTVLKGIVHTTSSSSSSSQASRHTHRMGPGRHHAHAASMMPAPQMLPTIRRVAAAKHIAPLVKFLASVDPTVATAAVRRLTKWLAAETAHGGAAGPAASSALAETVYAQVLHLSRTLDIPLGNDLPVEQAAALSAAVRNGACVEEGAELREAQRRGLLKMNLYEWLPPQDDGNQKKTKSSGFGSP